MELLDDDSSGGSGDAKAHPSDADHDHNPFTGDHGALRREEEDLAKFVAEEEAPEDRIASFVEELREEYRSDPDAARAMLDDIYEDLDSSGDIRDPEGEKREILERLAAFADGEEQEEWG